MEIWKKVLKLGILLTIFSINSYAASSQEVVKPKINNIGFWSGKWHINYDELKNGTNLLKEELFVDGSSDRIVTIGTEEKRGFPLNGTYDVNSCHKAYIIVYDKEHNIVTKSDKFEFGDTSKCDVPEPNDTIDPIIVLIGKNPQIVTKGQIYKELGATALDNRDGDLTKSIVVDSSNVDTSTVGDYRVDYYVVDASGNDVMVTRMVKVVSEDFISELEIHFLKFYRGKWHIRYQDLRKVKGLKKETLFVDGSAVRTVSGGFNSPLDRGFSFTGDYAEDACHEAYIVAYDDDDNNLSQSDVFEFGDVSKCAELDVNLTNGLIAYYEFEGNAKDSSGNGNDGTEQGGMSYASGVIGQAGSFDGLDDYVEVESKVLNSLTNNMSVSLFIKTDRSRFNDYHLYQGILAKGNDPRTFSLYTEFSDNQNFIHVSSTTTESYDLKNTKSQNEINLNSWNHVVVQLIVKNNKKYVQYIINGVIEEEKFYSNQTHFSHDTYNLLIGKTYEESRNFKGQIDDLRIYNRALNEVEIAELYKMGESKDSDTDGISDKREIELGLNPNSNDSDGDGILDLIEVGDIDNPTDTDGDGIIDALDEDSDNDGATDKAEVEAGTDPQDASSKPSICNASTAITIETLRTMIANNEDVTEVNTCAIIDMHDLFANNSIFNQDISGWDTSSVSNMKGMFFKTKLFNQPLNDWDTSNVTNMEYMFAGAEKFNQPLDNWDTSKVVNMGGMFEKYGNDVVFNQPLNSWDTSSVENISFMFDANKVFNQPLDNWDTSNVKYMRNIFWSAESFNQPIGNWDTSKVTDMQQMFTLAKAFNQNLNDWDTSNVTNMQYMFNGAESFNQPLDQWDVSNVTNMNWLFAYAKNFNQNIKEWDVTSETSHSYFSIGSALEDEHNPFKILSNVTYKLPLQGENGKDWFIVNYIDLDKNTNSLRDFKNGFMTYDGHNGTDIGLKDFETMDKGIKVIASRKGVVEYIHDGEFDRQTSCINYDWNVITIRHSDGSYAYYGHLKSGSILVAEGETVEVGTLLAEVGSSGCSTGPHIHFEVRDNNNQPIHIFEAGLADFSVPYPEKAYVFEEGLTERSDSNLNKNFWLYTPNTYTQITSDKNLVFWTKLVRLGKTDKVDFKLIYSDNHEKHLFSISPSGNYKSSYWYMYLPSLSAGDYRVKTIFNDDEDNATFYDFEVK